MKNSSKDHQNIITSEPLVVFASHPQSMHIEPNFLLEHLSAFFLDILLDTKATNYMIYKPTKSSSAGM
jgi:hypothetical protein